MPTTGWAVLPIALADQRVGESSDTYRILLLEQHCIVLKSRFLVCNIRYQPAMLFFKKKREVHPE